MRLHPLSRIRASVHHAVDGAEHRQWIFTAFAPILVTIGLTAMLVESAVPAESLRDRVLAAVIVGIWVLLCIEFLGRLWVAPDAADLRQESPSRARAIYLGSIHGLIDLAAALALPTAWVLGLDHRDGSLLTIVWALKYFRHSTGLSLLVRVALHSRAALFSVATVFFVAFLLASTLAYVFERKAQPEAFASVPRANSSWCAAS